jgi:hypothetical protein
MLKIPIYRVYVPTRHPARPSHNRMSNKLPPAKYYLQLKKNDPLHHGKLFRKCILCPKMHLNHYLFYICIKEMR